MSGLPILPATIGQLANMRVSIAAPHPIAGHDSSAAGKTATSSAVHQPVQLQKTEQVSRHVLSSAADKRSRLIGPPPTFEVNLLQHLQDTWLEPPDQDTNRDASPVRAANGPRDDGYATLKGAAQPDQTTALQLDRSA